MAKKKKQLPGTPPDPTRREIKRLTERLDELGARVSELEQLQQRVDELETAVQKLEGSALPGD